MQTKPAPLGILLANTGTPSAPTARAVRRFLAQFLSDQRVIDYARWFWLPLLYGVILNTRPRRSARLYERVWTADGSPLLTISLSLEKKLSAAVSGQLTRPVFVSTGMRYGEPSIPNGLRSLRDQGAKQYLILPLFPQYSSATTASTFDAVFSELQTWAWIPPVKTISDYHHHPAYIRALAAQIRKSPPSEKILFSFHGIPERYVKKGDPYADQCQRTTQLLAAELDLEPESWKAAYQSRFGPEPWTQPYTEKVLTQWGSEGISNLKVVCPGFAADCLETLDEIANEGKEIFQGAGGGDFEYIPALNDQDLHIEALTEIILDTEKTI
ncbi:MAG: ferrochelatase [Chloroflexota bacterium]